MCLPSVNWPSVALGTPNTNINKVQAMVLIISCRFQFSVDTIKMFGEVEIRLNQRDFPE